MLATPSDVSSNVVDMPPPEGNYTACRKAVQPRKLGTVPADGGYKLGETIALSAGGVGVTTAAVSAADAAEVNATVIPPPVGSGEGEEEEPEPEQPRNECRNPPPVPDIHPQAPQSKEDTNSIYNPHPSLALSQMHALESMPN